MTILINIDQYEGEKNIDFKTMAKITKLFTSDKSLSEDENLDCAMELEKGLLCYYVTKDERTIIVHLLDYITTII